MCAAVSWVSWLGLTKTQTKKAKIFVAFGCMRDQGNFRLVYDVSLKVSCQVPVLNFKVSWSCLDTTLETLTISVLPIAEPNESIKPYHRIIRATSTYVIEDARF
jgi:hypothetical protein